MCFSENISLSIGITGLLSSFYFYFYKKNIYASVGIGYFALMEILQFFQYKVINQCNNDYNKFLTNIGYIHICFQPLFFNIWLFAFTNKPNFTFLYMSFFAGLLLASRLFYVKDEELCDNKNEPLCGKKNLFIFRKQTHCVECKIACSWKRMDHTKHRITFFYVGNTSINYFSNKTFFSNVINGTIFRDVINK